jgi:hydroxymethylpyrimidine pyrophosphatase-like HAD family hydrolase
MLVHVLACDYDGTIAPHGVVPPDTRAALAQVRQSGRRVVLVTGRMLDELRGVCPDLDVMFDAVVAENGALLYRPFEPGVKILGERPEPALVDALGRRGVPIALGASIVATDACHAEPALAAIQETGVERTLVFNKGSLMLLPGGVTKATGLDGALAVLGLSPRNTIGVGDAENDHAFVAYCECAAAVADAVPALRERADLVTAGPSARGVVELIRTHVLTDAVDLFPRLARHWIRLGERADGTPVAIPAHRTRLLVVGPSAGGPVAPARLLLDRLVEAGRAVCVLDPAGDYRGLSELEGIVVLGGKAEQALPAPDELAQLLCHPRTSLVLDLSARSPAEKARYATEALAVIAAVRARCGVPHWVVVGDAPSLAPREGPPAGEWLHAGNESLCLVASRVEALTADARALATLVVSVDGAPRGEATLVAPGAPEPRLERFRLGQGRLAHRQPVA